MKFLRLSVIVVTFVSEILLINCNNSQAIVSVNTNNGKVNGRRKVVFGKTYNEFLSIPYAKPPIGNLRFKKPEPVNNWTTPINATHLPNPCFQVNITDTFLNSNFSEDCLYLNIWQPISETNVQNKSKAVMFFIHGGGLFEGSSSEYQFQGQILSTIGDVVLVTHNYRLSTFGFLYTGTDDAPGNVGLYDNVMALKWIRDNIRSFGGDPNKITIFGQSGGSWAVSMHILSPISRNLYQNAILISGALISAEIASQTYSKQIWLKGSKLIGCANQTDTTFNTRIINCLKTINASVLANFIISPEIVGNTIGTPSLVVIDGVFLPKTPVEMFESGNYKKNLNLMIGTVEDEGNVVLVPYIPGYDAISPVNFTYNESIANLIEALTRVPTYTTIDGKQAAKLYFDEISPNTIDYDLLRLTTAIASGDYLLACQTKVFVETVFKYDKLNSNVYEYYYKSNLGFSVYFCGKWMGACHGADLSPLFGLPFIYYNNFTDAQRLESNQVIGFYSHFAKYGYPSPQNGIDWPKYYSLNDNIVTPYLHIETNRSYFDYGLKITECQYLWKKYFYIKVPN